MWGKKCGGMWEEFGEEMWGKKCGGRNVEGMWGLMWWRECGGNVGKKCGG
jgi:hypothetical protein